MKSINKVAFVTNLCTHYRYKLFKLLAENYGFDFYFFENVKKTKEDIKHLGIIFDHPSFNYLPLTKIFRKLVKNRYGVIIKCTNNKWSFLGSLIIAKLIRAKFIVWHSTWYYPETLQYKLFSWLLRYILKTHADAIVVYGEHGKRFLTKNGINTEKIFIAWQTVDNELYGRNVSEEEIKLIKRRFNISSGKKVVLYVGRLVELKGIEYLLEALNKLDKTKFIFMAIGDGNLKSKIEKFCQENKIDYRLPGLINYQELPPFYKLATVLVLPSITTKTFKEPWGLVVNEAFNQGCPAVVTEAVGAGVGGLVKDGINGFVVKEKNVEELAKAIEKIIFNDSLRDVLSKNASEEIKTWTYERQAKGFLDAIKYSFGRLKNA